MDMLLCYVCERYVCYVSRCISVRTCVGYVCAVMCMLCTCARARPRVSAVTLGSLYSLGAARLRWPRFRAHGNRRWLTVAKCEGGLLSARAREPGLGCAKRGSKRARGLVTSSARTAGRLRSPR